MILVLFALLGVVLAAVAHDLGTQALDDQPLRPLAGTCPRCRSNRGWHRLACPGCGRRIGREVVLAAAMAAMAVALYRGLGPSALLAAYLGFAVLTAALVVSDLEEMRIVDRLNLPGSAILAVVLVLAALVEGQGGSLVRAFLGAAAYFAGTVVMFILGRGRGFGAGDVKLAPLLGLYCAFVSWGTLGWAVMVTAIAGGLVAIVILAAGRGRDAELPYGPPMVVGAWVALAAALNGAIPLPA
ncbi:MAG: A24 family peptidase [Actinomycetes bacterium]|nr:MAG: hypothetical protein DIU67_09470 [Actinomycetota bacterium]